MNKSESIKELATALSKAQGELENASKTSANPFFKSKYADLAEIINTSKKVLAENGLSVVQMPSLSDSFVEVETMLCHSSGEWISNVAAAPLDAKKHDPQGVGSAITYLRRYSLAAFLGIAQEDDDSNLACGKSQGQAPAPKPPTPKGIDLQAAVDDLMSGEGDLAKLKKAFGAYWKNALPEQQVDLKKAYDFAKSEIEAMQKMEE
jgi:hypothetical protein